MLMQKLAVCLLGVSAKHIQSHMTGPTGASWGEEERDKVKGEEFKWINVPDVIRYIISVIDTMITDRD